MTCVSPNSGTSNQPTVASDRPAKRAKTELRGFGTGLPLALQHKIYQLLSGQELSIVACVSKGWNAAANANFWNIMRRDLKLFVNERAGENVRGVVRSHLKWVEKWNNNEYCQRVVAAISETLPKANTLTLQPEEFFKKLIDAMQIQPATEAVKAIAVILLAQDRNKPHLSLRDLVKQHDDLTARTRLMDFFLYFEISFSTNIFTSFATAQLSAVDFNVFLKKVVFVIDDELKAKDPTLKKKTTAHLNEISREGRLFLFENLLRTIKIYGDNEKQKQLVEILLVAIRRFDITATEVVQIIQKNEYAKSNEFWQEKIFNNFLTVLALMVQEEAKMDSSVDAID